MRHLRSLLAAIVVAPSAWVLLALGQSGATGAFPAGGQLHAGDFLRPMLLLGAAGLLLGLVGTLRVSPLGAMVMGIVYTLSYTTLLVAPSKVVSLFSHQLSLFGQQVDLAAPIRSGTTMVLGVLLLVATASTQRWRHWPRPADEPADAMLDLDRPLGTDGLDALPRFGDLSDLPRRADLPRREAPEPEEPGQYVPVPTRYDNSTYGW
ncbi:hypothetical protein [Dactylosporangium sp. CA-092794]|uniref:hypothetical protein n=1 Tax=Dactylosporangium sp. CA-092794 TaxID=3239929 RepID=UPI003D8A4D96